MSDPTMPHAPFPSPAPPGGSPGGAPPPGQPAPVQSTPDQTWRHLLSVAALVLVVIGVAVEEDGVQGYSDWTAWAIFATIAAVVQLAPLAGTSLSLTPAKAWTVGAFATAALVGYWVIIVLPRVSANIGFAQTLGVAAAAVACWWSPERRW